MSDTNEQNKDKISQSNNQHKSSQDMFGDMEKIISLIKSGTMPQEQGLALLQRFTGGSQSKENSTSQQTAQNSDNKNQETDGEQISNNNNYNSNSSYSEIFDYLNKVSPSLNQDDYDRISGMIGNLENKAVEKYTKQMDYEKNLRNQNDSDKRRMTSNAQGYGYDGNKNRKFTRAEIGKMSTKEFLENEAAIYEQLRKGDIR